ncbi:hypothetical protein [Phenylobacterium sp.]|uniref:hypothetical protein n=1 Tax=Phenylobacterium sp. TaxID=1871053 RepID=UPI00356362BA
MPYIDPLKVVRNPATLQAYRQHQRALWAAAQPWLAIGLVSIALMIGLFLFALFHNSFRDLNLFFSLLMFAYGVSFGVAGIRIWRYNRSHPFVLPEAPSLSWGAKVD